MNALAIEVYAFKDKDEERFALRGLEGELHRWGRAMFRHSEHDGTPGANLLETFIGGSGGGIPGHRVLCLDMPTELYVVNMRILTTLTEIEQDVILVWYAVPPKEDGNLWSDQEKADKLEMSVEDLRRHRRTAKRRILGLPVET